MLNNDILIFNDTKYILKDIYIYADVINLDVLYLEKLASLSTKTSDSITWLRGISKVDSAYLYLLSKENPSNSTRIYQLKFEIFPENQDPNDSNYFNNLTYDEEDKVLTIRTIATTEFIHKIIVAFRTDKTKLRLDFRINLFIDKKYVEHLDDDWTRKYFSLNTIHKTSFLGFFIRTSLMKNIDEK